MSFASDTSETIEVIPLMKVASQVLLQNGIRVDMFAVLVKEYRPSKSVCLSVCVLRK